MRVLIGGAHNGKRKYVNEILLDRIDGNPHFFEGEIPEKSLFSNEDIIIIGNFEEIIKQSIHLDEEVIANDIFNKLMELENHAQQVICICTDITRGVVPILKEERKLRDTCGRLYQRLFSECDQIVRIWYGIPQVLKGEGL